MTDTHILYVTANSDQGFTSRAALPAAKVRAGQYVWITATAPDATASAAAAKPSRIVNVRRVTDVGPINPFTLAGEQSVAAALPPGVGALMACAWRQAHMTLQCAALTGEQPSGWHACFLPTSIHFARLEWHPPVPADQQRVLLYLEH